MSSNINIKVSATSSVLVMLGKVGGKIDILAKMRELGGVSYRIHCQQFTFIIYTTLTGGAGGGVGGGVDSPE